MRCEEQQLLERASGSFSSASSLFSMKRKTFKKERESFSLHSSGQSSPKNDSASVTTEQIRSVRSDCPCHIHRSCRSFICDVFVVFVRPVGRCVGDEANFPSGYSTDSGVAGEHSSLGFCIKLLVDVVIFSSRCPCCCVNTVIRMRMF